MVKELEEKALDFQKLEEVRPSCLERLGPRLVSTYLIQELVQRYQVWVRFEWNHPAQPLAIPRILQLVLMSLLQSLKLIEEILGIYTMQGIANNSVELVVLVQLAHHLRVVLEVLEGSIMLF